MMSNAELLCHKTETATVIDVWADIIAKVDDETQDWCVIFHTSVCAISPRLEQDVQRKMCQSLRKMLKYGTIISGHPVLYCNPDDDMYDTMRNYVFNIEYLFLHLTQPGADLSQKT